jgi:tetratricopeptide (TPR) repeat protein
MLRRLAESVPAGEAAGRVDYIRGLSLARRGEVKPAGEFFRQAAAASPRFAEPILRWVECLRDQGRFAEASSVLGDALSAGLQSSRRGWQAWLEVLFGDLGFTAREVLAAFPRMDTWMPVASEQEAFIKALAANEAVSLVCGASEASREPGAFAVPGSPARGYRMPMPRGRYRCTLDSGDCARRDCVWPVFDFLVEDKALAVNHGPGISTLRPVDRRAVTVEVVDGGLDIEFRHGSGLAHGFALTVQAEDKLDSTAAVEGNDGLPVENGDSSLEGGLRMSFLGRELEAAERWNEAECAYRQAMNLFESESGEARQDTAHAHLAHACFLLGQLLRRMGRSEQATELTAKAIAWNPEYGLPEELKSYPAIEAMIAGEVLPQGSSWRFRSGRETVAGEWAAPEFDDASWQEGASAFGYGTAGVGTELSDMQGNYTTVYLRKSFQLEEADLDARLRLEVTADDGFVAYLNGIEVARARAGAKGAILGSAATASENVREPVEPQVTEVPGEALRPGTNVLAIQGLNVAKESSDFTLLPVLRWEAPPAPDYEQDRLRLQHVLAGARGEIGRCRVAYVEGRLLQRVGRHREAVTRLSEALAHDGRHREPLVRAAESQRALGEARLAMTHLARALQQSGEEEADEILRSWFLVAAVDLGLDARSLRAELPAVGRESSGRYGADLRWALDRLIDEGALRLNCGGEEFRGKAGMVWGKDRFFLGGYRFYGDGIGGATSPFTDDIRETDDDPLYQTERWFPTQEIERALYRIPLPRGKYRVTLHFAEIYFRVQRVRVFDVMLEDRKVMESYDPSTPGFAVAQKHGFVVSVDDGELDIRFLERTDAPKISAIEVVRDN